MKDCIQLRGKVRLVHGLRLSLEVMDLFDNFVVKEMIAVSQTL